MIGFAVCVSKPEVFAAHAGASLARVREPDSVIAELTTDTSIHAAYNEALDHFAALDELEALVLLHEDVELRDPAFCARVREQLAEPGVAVLGTIGARGVSSLAWWEGELHGHVAETRGVIGAPCEPADVDSVDGLLLVLSPWAVRNLRFDEQTFTGFHAYDVDICFSARAAGRTVRCADLAVTHHTKGGYGDRAAWDGAADALARKWGLRPPAAAVGVAAAPAATSLLIVLDGDPDAALRCFESVAAVEPDQPEHDVVVVAGPDPALAPLLDRLEGDVTVVRSSVAEPFDAAVRRGLPSCAEPIVTLLSGAPVVAPRFLAPLCAPLADAACAAATSHVGDTGSASTPAALAARRADLAALAPSAPAPPVGYELAALALALGRQGRVAVAPASVATAQREAAKATSTAPRPSVAPALRRAPGEPVELSIVIPTLDAASERVRRCIAAVQATTDVAHEIVVIDNGAPPQGFTAPVNAGLRAARGRYLLVLNDDVELLPGWWTPLRAALDGGEAVVFPLTVDGGMRRDFAAWCFALTRDALELFGVADGEFLDPELVVWYQDTDLLERLRRAGRPPRCVEASQIRHGLSETVRSEDPSLRAWVARQVREDKAAFEAKHGTAVAGAAR